MKPIFTLFVAIVLANPAFAFDHSHRTWTSVLKKYQNTQGLVYYEKLKVDAQANKSHPLNLYLAEIQKVSLPEYESWSENQKKAFLINSYNATTIKLIVDHYPVASIKKIGGFFKKPWSIEFFSLFGGKIKSIDPIEHEWLRPKFKDCRVHAAVNCASISCPPLRNEAFVAEKLDVQLDEQMAVWLNDSTRNQIYAQKKLFELSKIFDWYKKDFDSWGGGVVAVVRRYSKSQISDEVASQIQLKYLDYNWALNEAK